tara:strand:+ start:202 stop:315 length:114 start_codon:yes stop_codon:yes gene_type:complete
MTRLPGAIGGGGRFPKPSKKKALEKRRAEAKAKAEKK